ncbi:MAG: LemA family protein [Deltaproteobacteria bacterium]|nr:LemA family protein [Deltaproteobacteria bacterium]
MYIIIPLVIIGLVVLWAVLAYNGLITLKNQVENAWRQIDVQLKRRHDLIPNLVNTVKGAMEFERDTLTRVVEARAKAMGAPTVREKAEAEGFLTEALGKLFALVESYPELKSNKNILQLQEELTSTENRIGFARQFYNDLIAKFNIRQSVFPTVIIASLMGFEKGEYFQAGAGEREVPGVDLRLK